MNVEVKRCALRDSPVEELGFSLLTPEVYHRVKRLSSSKQDIQVLA